MMKKPINLVTKVEGEAFPTPPGTEAKEPLWGSKPASMPLREVPIFHFDRSLPPSFPPPRLGHSLERVKWQKRQDGGTFLKGVPSWDPLFPAIFSSCSSAKGLN